MAASVAIRAYSKPASLDGDLLIVCQQCSAGCFLDRSPIRDRAENFPRRLVWLRNLRLPARSVFASANSNALARPFGTHQPH